MRRSILSSSPLQSAVKSRKLPHGSHSSCEADCPSKPSSRASMQRKKALWAWQTASKASLYPRSALTHASFCLAHRLASQHGQFSSLTGLFGLTSSSLASVRRHDGEGHPWRPVSRVCSRGVRTARSLAWMRYQGGSACLWPEIHLHALLSLTWPCILHATLSLPQAHAQHSSGVHAVPQRGDFHCVHMYARTRRPQCLRA